MTTMTTVGRRRLLEVLWVACAVLLCGGRAAAGVELAGALRYPDGEPVWGARVTVASAEDPQAAVTVLTDEEGAFRVELNPDPPTAVAVLTPAAEPDRPALFANYPNPFNPETLIPYRLAEGSWVRLDVYNSAGQLVRRLVDGFRAAGVHRVHWNATDERGAGVGAGAYFYRLQADGLVGTGKMLLVDGNHRTVPTHEIGMTAAGVAARPLASSYTVDAVGYGFADVHRVGVTEADMPLSIGVERVATPLGVDGHQHLDGVYTDRGSQVVDYLSAAQTAISIMDPSRVGVSIIMPPPISADPEQRGTYDYTALTGVVEEYPQRFAVAGGGGILSPMLHAAALSGELSEETRQLFRERAEAIAAAGVAAFGEMTALHLSFFSGHPFIGIPPDNQLFKDLADVAAQEGLPIDLHMEAVLADMPRPDGFGDPNPETLTANITPLEDLLRHNRDARIIWAHVGWDNTGDMTLGLLRDLLEAHDNLYMGIKLLSQVGVQVAANRPVDGAGRVRADWLALIGDYPDRFVLGADEFFGIPGLTTERPPSTAATWAFLDQLPEDLARRLAWENAEAVYRLHR